MDKRIIKAIRRDCRRIMWPCYLLGAFCALLSFLVPTLAAWLVGDMTDSLLSLDVPSIKVKLPAFLIAIVLEAVFLPLVQMLNSLLLVRQGGCYQTLLMGNLLRRPLTAFHKETGATVAEHIMAHAPSYYFIQISKYTLPMTTVVYGSVLLYTLFMEKIPLVFSVTVLIFAGLPLIRTAIFGKLTQNVAVLERDYETNRAQEEEMMFKARCFYRVNSLTEYCIRGFQEKYQSWYQNVSRQKRFLEAVRVVFEYLCNYGATLAVICVGAFLVLRGYMGVGALMTGYLLLPTLSNCYSTIAEQITDIREEKDVQSRLIIFYGETAKDLDEAEGEMLRDVPHIVQICMDHVTFSYPDSEHPVLNNWCGKFFTGEVTRLTGENGSGKSTLVRLISGLYAPKSGSIIDENGTILSKETLRRLVTIQEQEGYIFEGTVWDNLFAEEHQRAKAAEILENMAFEKSLDYVILPEAINLSPGEQHKILSARALLRESPFLILDEPLNHLDSTGANVLFEHLHQSKRGIILISHQECPLLGNKVLAITPQKSNTSIYAPDC